MRWLRRLVNPSYTGLTHWWLGVGRRQVPARAAPATEGVAADGRPRMFHGVASPGDWIVPAGQRPGWDWLPEHGASPDLRSMPRWARVWYRTPFVDRYAYEWMWWHGGWSVLVPAATRPGRRPEAG